jgi:hypothetical protein
VSPTVCGREIQEGGIRALCGGIPDYISLADPTSAEALARAAWDSGAEVAKLQQQEKNAANRLIMADGGEPAGLRHLGEPGALRLVGTDRGGASSKPGKPIQNVFVVSFIGRFRDECLNQRWFGSLATASGRTARSATDRPSGSRAGSARLDSINVRAPSAALALAPRLCATPPAHLRRGPNFGEGQQGSDEVASCPPRLGVATRGHQHGSAMAP